MGRCYKRLLNLLLTVGYLHVLGVPQGGGDHEHQGQHQLQAEQRHQPRHREGRHHRVGLLQIATGNIRGDQGERILLLLLLLLLDIWAVSLMVSDLVIT